MILKDDYSKEILQEHDEVFNKHWFDRKRDKVIHNIDTLYVSADVKGSWNEIAKNFVKYLHDLKAQREVEQEVYIEKHNLYVSHVTFVNYVYCLESKDEYMLMFCKTNKLENTPSIFVQIRSEFLWLYGEHECLKRIDAKLSSLLNDFNLTLDSYKINRIDYAYHTNYIKNMTSFFSKLNAMQVSNFQRGSKEFEFTNDEDEDVDYISLGRRKSNNLFVRIYNKTQEVINKSYKQFFIGIWHQQGFISNYDKYIYEKAFLKKSYRYLVKARLEFFIEYGTNEEYKTLINELLNDKTVEYDYLQNIADLLTPRPTLITNVEFQTQRKFYGTFSQDVLKILENVTELPSPALTEVYKLLDHKVLIHNLLTTDVLRLVDPNDNKTRKRNKEVSPFWKLVQDCKMGYTTDQKMLRTYQKNLDIEMMKRRLIYSMSTFSLYMKQANNDDLLDDTLGFLEYINENDLQNALDYKNKKAPTLKNKLQSLSKVEVMKRFALLDKANGTYIE